MITVHYITIKRKDKFLNFKNILISEYPEYLLIDFSKGLNVIDRYILEGKGIIIYDFENCNFDKYVLMHILEKAKDVIIFINEIVLDLKEAKKVKNLINFEHIIGNEFIYNNYANEFSIELKRIRDARVDINGKTFSVNIDIKRFVTNNFDEILMFTNKNQSVCNIEVSIDSIFSSLRNAKLVFIRHVLAYLLVNNKCSTKYTGQILDKDHTTIINSRRVIEDYLQVYADNQDKLIIENLIKKMGIELKKANGITV
jgi:chromosomal replication initiation ATPase DnaA